jgi:hypothetical protein
MLASSLVTLGLAIVRVGSLFRYADPTGTMHSDILIVRSIQSILPSIPSIFSIHPDCIRAALSLSSRHLSSSTLTSYRILTTLPPSVYHPPNVLASTDSTSYHRLHYLPEWYITRYGWFAALLQYVAAGLLSDVTQYAQHAEGAVYTKGLETHMKQWGTTSLSIVRMLEGKTVSALLAELEEQHPVYYRLRLSVKPAPGTSWFDALANAPGSKFAHVLVDGVRKIVPRSLLAVPRPRHLYVMVVYRALRYHWALETFP